jgi:flagellar biosynthesis protein FlhB
MAEDLGEKTELPTGRRLEDARAKGQVAKSQDLSAAIDLITCVVLIAVFGGSLIKAIASVMRHVLERPYDSLDPRLMGGLLLDMMGQSAAAVAPVLGLLFVLGIAAHVMQVGFLFTTQPLTPNFSRLNPVNGLGRLMGRRNLVKTLVACIKLTIVVIVAYLYLSGVLQRIAGLPLVGALQGIGVIGKLALQLALWLLAILLAIGATDWLYQRWQHTQDLKMTKDEVKDERRSMEGDPQIKGRRMKIMRNMAMSRVNQSVPKADVIVTNPTHYSVAIEYDAATMRAPRVVAKGVDFMAMHIRRVAMIHKVPIVERPPLARGLYHAVEVGQEVSPEFYQAVAELLAYVYRLERQAA